MRIRYWSSYVCSSDLIADSNHRTIGRTTELYGLRRRVFQPVDRCSPIDLCQEDVAAPGYSFDHCLMGGMQSKPQILNALNSEERRVATELVRSCRFRGTPVY